MLFNKKTAFEVGTLAGWTSSLMGASRSSSGQTVTVKSALGIPILQNCVSLLAESLAQLPVELYRRLPNGGRQAATDHKLYPILKYAPNGWQTPFEYREIKQISAGLRGNSYSWIDRNGRGEIIGLYPIDPAKVTMLKGPDLLPYYQIDGAEPVPQRLIHHVRWFSLDGYMGLSPIALHANALGYTQALAEYSAKSFVHGTALSGVLERPKDAPKITSESDVDAIANKWVSKFGGSSNSGRVAVLQEGMTFKPLTMSNVDAELIDALKMTDVDMGRIYKIPLPMVGSMEGATYNNVENLQIQYVVYALMPWIRRHEQAMQRDFLNTSEREQYYIEFNVGGLLRGNQTARYAAYAVGRQWGWLSINDIRRLENLPPISGGDAYLQPLNMIDATDPKASRPPKEADAKALAEISEILK